MTERKVYVRAMARLSCRTEDPDFSPLFSVLEARRLSPLMKRAVYVSQQVLSEAGVAVPDAVLTGTGLGCIGNTELFLKSLTGVSDAPLRPTHFMQSTHNTVGSLIAIRLHCHGCNVTYSHGGISFESALLDAFLQLKAGRIDNALVGAFEEMTPDFAAMLAKAGILDPYKDGKLSETAVSMLLTASPEGALCELADVQLGGRCRTRADVSRMTRADYVPLYGDNFCVSALGACDAVFRLASAACGPLLVENDFHGKSFATLLFSNLCGD